MANKKKKRKPSASQRKAAAAKNAAKASSTKASSEAVDSLADNVDEIDESAVASTKAKKVKATPTPKAEKPAKSKAKATPTPKAEKPAKAAARTAAPAKKKGLGATAQWAIILGIGAVIIGFIIFNGVRDATDTGGPGDVTTANFDLPNLEDPDNLDDRVRISDFEGTPTVVNFFASWCTACDEELPAFRDTALALEGEVDFIFVNSNETGDWQPMADRNNIGQFPLARDIQGTRRNGLYRSLGGTGGMPITAFYDANGDLITTAFTPFSEQTLDIQLRQLGLI